MKKLITCLMVAVVVMASFPMNVVHATSNISKPVIKVKEVSKKDFNEETTYDVRITLENSGGSDARALKASLVEEQEGPLNIESAVTSIYEDTLKKDSITYMDVKISVDKDAKSGTYPLKIKGNYERKIAEGYNEQKSFDFEEEIYFNVISPDVEENIVATIKTADKLYAGGKGKVTLTLEENKGESLQNLEVSMIDTKEAGIKPQSQGALVIPFLLKSSESREFDVYVDDNVSGYLPMKFEVKYKNEMTGKTKTKEITLYAYVEDEGTNNKSNVIIKEIRAEKNSIDDGASTKIHVTLENTAEKKAKNVQVTAVPDKGIILEGQGTFTVAEFAKGQKEYTFVAKASKEVAEGNYSVTFNVKSDDDTLTGGTSIFVINPEKSDNISAPKVIVKSFEIDKDKVYVGDKFNLTLTIENTSTHYAANNIKAIVKGSDDGKALLPINQSSSIYLGNLAPKANKTITIPYEVLANVEGGVYQLELEFGYEDKDINALKDKELIYIPVYAKSVVKLSDVSIGRVMDNGYTLKMDFYNTGTTEIKNMMVDVEGEFETTNSNYYVGDFKVGKMDTYEVQVVGNAPEKVKGKIKISYNDTFGKTETIEKDFDVTNMNYVSAEEKAAQEAMMQEQMMNAPQTKQASPIGGVLPIILVVAGVVVVVILVKRHKRKKEEE